MTTKTFDQSPPIISGTDLDNATTTVRKALMPFTASTGEFGKPLTVRYYNPDNDTWVDFSSSASVDALSDYVSDALRYGSRVLVVEPETDWKYVEVRL